VTLVVGMGFAFVVFSAALWAGRHLQVRLAVPLIALLVAMVISSFYVVRDLESWGTGTSTGFALALATHIALVRRRPSKRST